LYWVADNINQRERISMARFSAYTALIIVPFYLLPALVWAQSEKQGVALYNQAKDISTKAKSNQDLEKAIDKYQQALKIFENTGSTKLNGGTLHEIGFVYQRLGRHQKALEYYKQALVIRRKIGHLGGEGATLFNMGEIYRRRGEYSKALECHEMALGVFKKDGNNKYEVYALNMIGEVYRSLAQYDKAMKPYEKALALERKAGDLKGESDTLNNMGLVYIEWGQYQKALEHLENSLAINKKVGDAGREAVTLDNIGEVYRERHEYARALVYYEKSLAINKRLGAVRLEAISLSHIGLVFSRLGQYEKALESHQKALDIFKKEGDLTAEGTALANIGDVYRAWSRYALALECYDKALAIDRKTGAAGSEATTLAKIGHVYFARGLYDKALAYHETALALRRKLGLRHLEQDSLTEIGSCHVELGDYPKALECFEKGLAIGEEMGNLFAESVDLGNIGNVYFCWGRYQKAFQCYEKAIATFRKIGELPQEAVAVMAIGSVRKSLGQYQAALECYERSHALYTKLENPDGEASALMKIGSILGALGEHEKAIAKYAACLAIRTRIGVATEGIKDAMGNQYLDNNEIQKAEPLIREAGSRLSLGRLALSKGNFMDAVKWNEEYLSLVEGHRPSGSFAAHVCLGLSYEGLENYERASDHFKRSIEFIQWIRDGLNEPERINFYDVRIGGFSRLNPYESLSRALLRISRPGESFKYAEATKATLFAESLSRRGREIQPDVPKAVVDEDSDITNRLAAMVRGVNKAYEKGSEEGIEYFQQQIKELRAERDAHVSKLRKDYPRFAATRYPQPMDLQESGLKDDEWVLEYEVTDSGVVIFLIQGKKIVKSLFKALDRKKLDHLVARFREPLDLNREKLLAFDFASGTKLADLLLANILDDLPRGVPLIIVPDDSLGTLPFEALVLNEGGKAEAGGKSVQITGAEFLGDRNPLSYYQSVTALTLARTLGKQHRAGDRTLAMVDPVFATDDPRLKQAAAEKRRALLDKLTNEKLMSFKSELSMEIPRLPLTAQLGESLKKADPGNTDLYEGLTAQKAMLFQKDLKPYHSLVFATHGYFGKDLPGIQEPVLILTLPGQPEGQDGFLRLTEVMSLKLNCEVAALTACQTGLGRHVSGEGTMGMGRAFQYAGARSVLMSLWSVSERSSVNLVESFFKHLRQGKNKLEALRLARDEIRKAGYDHPFFWAPFILVGEVD